MQDRVPIYPGRVTLTPVEGQENTYDMVRADQPTQIGTALSKANLLTDDVAAQFGLDSSAVPNDILSWLGKYNEYWWSLLHGEAYYVYSEAKSNISGDDVQIGFAEHDDSRTYYISYSKSISISDTGSISLASEEKLETGTIFGSKAGAALTGLAPCYIRDDYSGSNNIYYIPEGATYSEGNYDNTFAIISVSSGFSRIWLCVSPNAGPSAQLVSSTATIVPAGETTYEHSTDRNAYPDSGTVDGITYTYLGCPFEKFPTAPQIETGSYTGTGSTITLYFPFKPKVVFIYGYLTSSKNSFASTVASFTPDVSGSFSDYYRWYNPMSNSPTASSSTKITWSNDYTTLSFASMLNGSGYTYFYITFG